MIRKILIANRGEIAVRIVRACAEMGITSVAIYAEPDRHSLHVKKADEAYNIGPDTVAGYLNVHRIVNPPASVIRNMGDKIEARKCMQSAGVPVVPGSDENLPDVEAALSLAEEIGYPIMLKATMIIIAPAIATQ